MSISPNPRPGRASRERGAAEPARYALLGLLLERPAHGYELARRFDAGSALGDIIHLSASHLYALLSLLERDGLIAGEEQQAGARPLRRVFALTGAGRDVVLHWLDEPVAHPRDTRIELPLKLYIARSFEPARARRLLERQRSTFEAYIERLASTPLTAQSPEDTAFMELMREARIGRARAVLTWLDRVQHTLEGL
ncbi:MAG TPA: PadR family transcriptional regulator [Chloroflexota bacterium]|nr:PadR family transcriptional regulator [Chloroflexota bacterium]